MNMNDDIDQKSSIRKPELTERCAGCCPYGSLSRFPQSYLYSDVPNPRSRPMRTQATMALFQITPITIQSAPVCIRSPCLLPFQN